MYKLGNQVCYPQNYTIIAQNEGLLCNYETKCATNRTIQS